MVDFSVESFTMGLEFRGSVFRVDGRGFKVQSSGLRAEGQEGFKSLGFRVHG